MKRNIEHILIRIAIFVFFILLVWVLFYSLFYYKQINCNAKLNFKIITNCSEECIGNCISEGFSVELNHTFMGEKIFVEERNREIIKEVKCVCQCRGCRK